MERYCTDSEKYAKEGNFSIGCLLNEMSELQRIAENGMILYEFFDSRSKWQHNKVAGRRSSALSTGTM